jgi:hypothetical protein
MTLPEVVRLDRFQTVMKSVLTDATGCQTSFGRTQGVYDDTFSASFISVLVDGPVYPATTGARGFTIQPCASIAFVVTAATTGQLVAAYVNQIPFRHQVEAGDTVDTIRDSLVEAIAADEGGEFTAVAGGGAGAWTLTPTSFGSIWSARKLGSMTGTVTLEDGLASVTQGTAQFTATFEAFSKNRTPRGGAMNLALKAMTALQMPSYSLTFRDYGVGIGLIGEPVDLSAIAGGNWETRVAFDVTCNLLFSVSSEVDSIETVDLSSQVTAPLLTSTIEVAS